MGYQPISGEGLGWQVPDIAGTLLRARAEQRAQDANRWAMLRDQGQQGIEQQKLGIEQQRADDYHQTVVQQNEQQRVKKLEDVQKRIQELHEAGMPLQAQQFARLHGLTPTVQPIGPAPQAPEDPSQRQIQDPQPTAMAGPVLDAETTHNLAIKSFGKQNPYDINDPTYSDRAMAFANEAEQGRAGMETDLRRYNREFRGAREAREQQAADVQAFPAQQAQFQQDQAAYDKQAANPVVSYSGPGVSFTVDPRERLMAARAKQVEDADRFRQVFQGDPGMARFAGEFGARVELGEPQAQVFGDLRARQQGETTAARDAEKQAHAKEYSPLALEQAKELARINAGGRVAAATAGNPFKADTGNRQDMGALRQELKDWRAANQLAVDAKSAKRLRTILANINSGNAMQQREAAESMVSVFKGGGQVTKASQDLLLKHLAGTVGDAQTWVQEHLSGHYGEQELNVLKGAAAAAMQEQQEAAKLYYESAVERFGPGSGWENLGPNVNHHVKSEFKQFGLDVPDLYQGAEGGVTIGSGERPKPQKAPPPAEQPKVLHGPGGKTLTLGADGKYH